MDKKTVSLFGAGCSVEVRSLRRRGVVVEGPNRKGQYCVELAHMQMWVAEEDLKPVATEDRPKKKKPKQRAIQRAESGRTIRIDLHGRTQKEALVILESTLDRALLEGAAALEIIHGLGTGTLRKAVESYLSRSPHIATFQNPPGNPGCVIAYLC